LIITRRMMVKGPTPRSPGAHFEAAVNSDMLGMTVFGNVNSNFDSDVRQK
jgi:hypothetical protein